jgi:alanine racemase
MADGAAVMPVVKADAYGHGMIPVAAALESAGVDGLCVATLDEALALRNAGIRSELIVLYPVPAAEARTAAEADVTVTAGDAAAVAELLAASATSDSPQGDGAAGAIPSVELEVETGLGRGGIPTDDVVPVARRILDAGGRLAGVWSHLQETEVEATTAEQVRRFEATLARLEEAGIRAPRRHLSASAALVLAAVPVYDAVRPGLVTYGLVPEELTTPDIASNRVRSAASRLKPVMALVARPVRVADLPAGHGVSYGPTWRAARTSRIATLPVGYGDGWSRSLSNRGRVLVRGVRVAIVGNVAMDATMVDVTDVPGAPVGTDDEFVLLGRQGSDQISAAELARWRTTNSWEVVTAMSARLTRVYHAAAGPAGTRSLGSLETRWLASNSGTATSATSRSTRS